MDLYLVRHGESEIPEDAVQTDFPLSALGREQAARVGERFARLKINHLITTPYKRTQETAQAIAAPAGVKAIEEPGLGAVDPATWAARRSRSAGSAGPSTTRIPARCSTTRPSAARARTPSTSA